MLNKRRVIKKTKYDNLGVENGGQKVWTIKVWTKSTIASEHGGVKTMCCDKGQIEPKTVVRDCPTYF